jgi:dipeptidyl-peptidase-3
MSEVDIRLQGGFDIGDLHPEKILSTLSPQQLSYATYLSLASWAGFPIVASQVSPHSLAIHNFLSSFFRTYPRDSLVAASTQPDTNLFYFLEYAATFYNNCSNYFGWGDNKFIPFLPKDSLLDLVSPYPDLSTQLSTVIDAIYSSDIPVRNLGWGPKNLTAYYSPSDFSESEQIAIDALLKTAGISVNNTIIAREDSRYNVKVFSIEIDEIGKQIGDLNGKPVVVTHGTHSEVLKTVNHWLTLARDFALNPIESDALSHLIKHYETGDIQEHIKYSELWVKDFDPAIESYHGTIENYRDPAGVRCEFEGFVAAVDPEESRVLHTFVNESSKILPLLPYPSEYERPDFTAPSYNAINILTFCVSGTPIGINLPNYDEVRIHHGFKNVSLSNVMTAVPLSPSKFPFVTQELLPLYIEHFDTINVLATAGHELYGHGSGALLLRADIEKGVPDLIHPERKVKTYYQEGETYQEVFGSLGPALEECRAETTSLHLCYKEEVLDIFGIPTEKRLGFKIAATLDILHQAMKGLGHYVPEVVQWKQAHARARFAILRAVLMWGNGGVGLKNVDGVYQLFIDESNFEGIVDSVALLLKYLNYYRATRKPEQAKEFLGALTSFDDYWLDVRSKVIKVKKPRGIFVGAVIKKIDEGGYTLERFTLEKPTVLDAALSVLQNIEVASHI